MFGLLIRSVQILKCVWGLFTPLQQNSRDLRMDDYISDKFPIVSPIAVGI